MSHQWTLLGYLGRFRIHIILKPMRIHNKALDQVVQWIADIMNKHYVFYGSSAMFKNVRLWQNENNKCWWVFPKNPWDPTWDIWSMSHDFIFQPSTLFVDFFEICVPFSKNYLSWKVPIVTVRHQWVYKNVLLN